MEEVIREFLLESHENLAQLDADLVALEKDPHESETLARVFRTLHTVKGTAGFLGFSNLQAVAHAAEHLLTKLRSGQLVFNPDIADALLSGVDAIRAMLANVEAKGGEGEGDYQDLIRWLDELQIPTKKSADSDRFVSAVVSVPKFPSVISKIITPPPSELTPSQPVASLTPGTGSVSSPSFSSTPNSAISIGATRTSALADSAVRVDVRLLDQLMTLAGELVLARNQILQHTNNESFRDCHALLSTVQHLNVLTSDLQANVMQTRMQPISSVWSKFPRVVRDLAAACGKEVALEMEGQETELDKTLIEAIRDPLTHLLRNAVDHGIESPEQRRESGKPVEGKLRLRAKHSGGMVTIELSDDGGGIQPYRVREKAVSCGLIPADEAMRLADHEVLKLVFLPGFSTTDQVTQFSGRGVGMDVVRTRIGEIGGSVELESLVGVGTTLRLKIPLTLAIIPSLITAVGSHRFCVPMANVDELLLYDPTTGTQCEEIHGAKVYRVRDQWLPIVSLHSLFENNHNDTTSLRRTGVIVVVQADAWRYGILVDAIHDTEEIVVKPLQQFFKALYVYSGATVLGDGQVAMILDISGLAKVAKIEQTLRSESHSLVNTVTIPKTASLESLVVELRDGGRVALPLNIVDRVDELDPNELEVVGGAHVIQYRGGILPLFDLCDLLAKSETLSAGFLLSASQGCSALQVVVCTISGQTVGLHVHRVIDISKQELDEEFEPTRDTALFNAVVLGRITEFPDLVRLAERMTGINPSGKTRFPRTKQATNPTVTQESES